MKAAFAAVVLALSIQTGGALAETTATGGDACPLSGDATGASDECVALRASYAAEVGGCMDAMNADAKGKSAHMANAHSMRARQAICSAQARIDLGIDAKGLAAAD